MEESFLHLWDELDDVAGACRHIVTSAAAEVLAAAPLIAAASAALLAGAATLLLSYRAVLDVLT